MDCGKLTGDIIAKGCGADAVVGVNGEIILINFDDVDMATTKLDGNVITELKLKAGKTAYKFETYDNAITPTVNLVKGTYKSTWSHSLLSRVFVRNQEIKDQIDNMTGGRFVAIVSNKSEGAAGDTKYEAYGFRAGIELTEATSAGDDADGVIYALTLATSEASKEPTLPLSVYKTDIASTKTMIDALLAAEPAPAV